MKHKLIVALLFGTLLFGQVAINLFHTEHHWKNTDTNKSNNKLSVLTKHADHCKVCALDFLHGLVFYEEVFFVFSCAEESFILIPIIERKGLSISFSQSRAPPVS